MVDQHVQRHKGRQRHTGTSLRVNSAAINPIGIHLVVAGTIDAGGDRSSAGLGSSREIPIRLHDERPDDFDKSERLGSNPFPRVTGRIGIEDEHHQPDIFGIVSLPTADVPTPFDLDSHGTVLCRVARIVSRWNQIGMPVVVRVPGNRLAVFGDCCRHELPDDAAEVRWHQERFESLNFLV